MMEVRFSAGVLDCQTCLVYNRYMTQKGVCPVQNEIIMERQNMTETNRFRRIKRILCVLLIIVSLPMLAYGIFLLAEPLARPDKWVRDYVVRRIPLGTDMNDAVSIINSNGWSIKERRDESGLRINDSACNVSFAVKDDMRNGAESDEIRIVGQKAMLVKLGEYSLPLHTAVFAYLAFDENERAVEAVIRRDIDAP